MSTVLIVLAWVALFHLVYEGIVAPSTRMKLRNRLFVVRDEVRAIKIEGVHAKDEPAFWLVHNGINSYLSRLPNLTVARHVAVMEAYRRDPELRRIADECVEKIQSAEDTRLSKALDKAVVVVSEAWAVNSGGWLIYVVPFIVVLATLKSLKRLAARCVALPERYAERVMPQQI